MRIPSWVEARSVRCAVSKPTFHNRLSVSALTREWRCGVLIALINMLVCPAISNVAVLVFDGSKPSHMFTELMIRSRSMFSLNIGDNSHDLGPVAVPGGDMSHCRPVPVYVSSPGGLLIPFPVLARNFSISVSSFGGDMSHCRPVPFPVLCRFAVILVSSPVFSRLRFRRWCMSTSATRNGVDLGSQGSFDVRITCGRDSTSARLGARDSK